MKSTPRVLSVGSGGAGSAAAATLNDAVPSLRVVVVEDELRLPYNRTTVNKGLLSGAVDDAGAALTGRERPGVTWRTGSLSVHLDASARRVTLADGEELDADAVIIATGAHPRPLPLTLDGPEGERVVRLRSTQDTARLRTLLSTGSKVLIVDATAMPMLRLLGPTFADWALHAHRAAGVEIHTRTPVTGVGLTGRRALAVALSDGTRVRPQVVLVALGVLPATGWLLGSGIELGPDGAVAVDAEQRVRGCPGVYAAGDLAAVRGPDGQPIRVEHWGAALAQGRTATRTALADLGFGGPQEVLPVQLPSYSTYVHGTKLTVLGWSQRATGELPLHSLASDDRFAVALHDQRDRLVSAVGVGGARAGNRIRALLVRQAPVSGLDLQPTAHG